MLVLDDLLPQWMVEKVASELPLIPVSYTNSPYGQYHISRFFGQLLIKEEQWIAPIAPHWFVDYLHMLVCNEVLVDYNIDHLDRCLLNCQTPGQHAQMHTDACLPDDSPYAFGNRLSGIYQVVGDGDTVFYRDDTSEMGRVPFRPGRLIIFDSLIWHQGEPPVNEPIRYSLGYIWKTSKPLPDNDPLQLRKQS